MILLIISAHAHSPTMVGTRINTTLQLYLIGCQITFTPIDDLNISISIYRKGNFTTAYYYYFRIQLTRIDMLKKVGTLQCDIAGIHYIFDMKCYTYLESLKIKMDISFFIVSDCF